MVAVRIIVVIAVVRSSCNIVISGVRTATPSNPELLIAMWND